MNKQLTLIASSLVMAFSSPSLFAQDSVSQFDEIVVSGTRTEESIKNIPASVAKVTSEQMNKNLATDVKQALKYVPGVSVNGQGRFGMEDITIRGMKGSRVKVLVDGVEQPTSYNPGADVMRRNSNNYEIDTLKAIEVNKGPTSTLYGSDALGGTVIMQTKNPEDLLKGESSYVGLKSGYASADDQYKLGVEAAKRIGDLETMIIYTYRNGHETDAYDTHDNSKGVTRKSADPLNMESHNVLAKAFYQINNANRIGFTGEYYTRNANGNILSRDGYSVMPGFTYIKTRGDDTSSRKRFGFEHEWLAENVVFDSLKWQVNWQQQRSQHNNYDHTDMFGDRNRYREGNDTSTQFDIQFAKAIEFAQSRHQLTYGATVVNDKFDLNYVDYNLDNGTSKPGPTEVPTAKSEKRGVFIQDQVFLLNDKAVVTAGARYDEFEAKPDAASGLKDHKSDAFTARLGAVYHWTDNFSTYGQYSQGFRAPTLHEMYYDKSNIPHGYIIKSNPNLKPEESNSYELGLRAENHVGNVTASVFYNDYSNFIQKVTTNANNLDITTNENIEKARIYGAELSANVWLDEVINAPLGTYAKVSIAYLDGEDKQTGKTLDTIAPLTSVVGVGYDAPNEVWGTALDVKMVAAKDNWQDKGNLNVAGYTTVDLTTYYHPVKDMTVRAGLFNALDKEYWQYQDMAGVNKTTDGIDRRSQPGRNFGINVNYDF
ncbi:TonB-dependent hemoglobin/transferrin/lactoferrin family receptor [Photobacterium phosphoreum]|uniref:TonB-dependent hemoglobin/transferrin/lactoferrin family receptor n=1 Tax=Photobacterium phosphoreum TaxID=659 RepID=UPI000D173868|nr:TonB-dependent hemoglobin/transferrin/lactoferrin family receptor [Photobacterium phosphoreum]PSW33325.1 TonB-dependent hemoglobin/transferrin/lactoferrin family receptor [Photobacterium phosphoreum]